MKFTDIERKVTALRTEIEAKEKQLQQAKDRVDRAGAEIDSLFETFKTQMLNGKETKITEVEEAIQAARREEQRDKVLIGALEDALPKLRAELAGLIEEKNTVFTRLALAWTRKEIENYDRAVNGVITSARRLFICFEKMREADHSEAFKEEVGRAFDYISGLKIPEIRNFNAQQYSERRHPGLSAGRDDIERVIAEIIKG